MSSWYCSAHAFGNNCWFRQRLSHRVIVFSIYDPDFSMKFAVKHLLWCRTNYMCDVLMSLKNVSAAAFVFGGDVSENSGRRLPTRSKVDVSDGSLVSEWYCTLWWLLQYGPQVTTPPRLIRFSCIQLEQKSSQSFLLFLCVVCSMKMWFVGRHFFTCESSCALMRRFVNFPLQLMSFIILCCSGLGMKLFQKPAFFYSNFQASFTISTVTCGPSLSTSPLLGTRNTVNW